MNSLDQLMLKTCQTSKNWGYITLLLGVLAIALPMVIGLAVTLLFALALISIGVIQLLAAWPGEIRRMNFRFVWAILTLVAGMYMVITPKVGLATLTLFIGSYFLVDGIANIAAALQQQHAHGRWAIALGGLSSLVMALVIVWLWPQSSEFVIGILIGLKLLVLGVTLLTVGRRVAQAVQSGRAGEKQINP